METFQIGQIVKYSKPVDKDEVNARFTVIEISPAWKDDFFTMKEKLTVEFICNMTFKPVNCFFSEEFTKS